MKEYSCIVCSRHYSFEKDWPEDLKCSWQWTEPQPLIHTNTVRVEFKPKYRSYGTAEGEWQIRNIVWHCAECVVPDAIPINYNTTDNVSDYKYVKYNEPKVIELDGWRCV